jgi:hypothetical protein
MESRSIHLGESGLYIVDDVHARVFTSTKIWYYRMQWPTTELVFPRFSTLLLLIKKRAAPDTHGLALSVIYYTDSISSMYGKHIDLYISRWDIRLSSYTLTLFSTAKLSGATRSDKGLRFMEHFSKSTYT